MVPYQSETEIAEIVHGFETCATPADDFKHQDHLVVAIWYLQRMDQDAALDRMRTGLLRYLSHHGVDSAKYSDEITRFWIDRVAASLTELGPETSLVDQCNSIAGAADFAREIYVAER